jgi:hypothetical protein
VKARAWALGTTNATQHRRAKGDGTGNWGPENPSGAPGRRCGIKAFSIQACGVNGCPDSRVFSAYSVVLKRVPPAIL